MGFNYGLQKIASSIRQEFGIEKQAELGDRPDDVTNWLKAVGGLGLAGASPLSLTAGFIRDDAALKPYRNQVEAIKDSIRKDIRDQAKKVKVSPNIQRQDLQKLLKSENVAERLAGLKHLIGRRKNNMAVRDFRDAEKNLNRFGIFQNLEQENRMWNRAFKNVPSNNDRINKYMNKILDKAVNNLSEPQIAKLKMPKPKAGKILGGLGALASLGAGGYLTYTGLRDAARNAADRDKVFNI